MYNFANSVVVLILDNTLRVRFFTITTCITHRINHIFLQPILNSDEVASLFSHPLISFLSSTPPFPSEPDTLEVPYHTAHDVRGGPVPQTYRVHQFLTGREAGGIKPVFGLTALVFSSYPFPPSHVII